MNRLALEWWMHDNRRSMTAALVACTAVVSLATRPALTDGTWPEELVDVVAWAMVATGVALRLWATAFIGGQKNRQLVTTGPYRVVRHPLYLGSALALFGIVLMAQRFWALLPAALLLAVYGLVAAVEDRRLSKQFSNDSELYRGRTHAWWPSWSGLAAALHDRPDVVLKRAIFRELACSVGFLAVTVLAEISEATWWSI
jgi:protein-S-isoprenylcysteine O-methyltransferase Ste14